MQTVFERLRQARQEAGYETAAAAIERFGFKKSAYINHENGERGLRPAVAAKYARAFKVNVTWLLYGTGDKSGTISQEQIELLDRFNCLPSSDQAMVVRMIDTLLQASDRSDRTSSAA